MANIKESNMLVPKDYMKQVYYAEKTNHGWDVMKGYLLAHYMTSWGMRYIVTLGDITSCVVRHVEFYSTDRRGAWTSIADKENLNNEEE